MENQSGTPTFEEYVKLTLNSGVAPLELAFVPVTDCDSGRPLAFRTRTVINSVIAGTLKETEYAPVCDKRNTGAELFVQSVKRVASALKAFKDCDPPIKFLSLRCPAEVAENPDFDAYAVISDALNVCKVKNPSALCVEFPASLLEKDSEKAKRLLLDISALKVKTMITGCGGENFFSHKLATVQPSAVMLDKTATAWAGSRDKPNLVQAMIAYINSMGIEAYAEGESDKRRELRRTDCAGFTDCNALPLDVNKAVELAKAEYEV